MKRKGFRIKQKFSIHSLNDTYSRIHLLDQLASLLVHSEFHGHSCLAVMCSYQIYNETFSILCVCFILFCRYSIVIVVVFTVFILNLHAWNFCNPSQKNLKCVWVSNHEWVSRHRKHSKHIFFAFERSWSTEHGFWHWIWMEMCERIDKIERQECLFCRENKQMQWKQLWWRLQTDTIW